jgi:para-nitrobenzyl esterase
LHNERYDLAVVLTSDTVTTDVETESGTVRGTTDRAVSRWRSIPYAAPPLGDLRFRAPQPVAPWAGAREATRFGNAAIQHHGGSWIGWRKVQPVDEDCLTLNVTAPATPSATLRPVIVFIHGGGYLFGTSALGLYSGVRLVTTGDVVFVSLNYRLGAFGYLDFTQFASPDRPFESNLGLRDQVAALNWVRRNIAAFGGDPGNVTIMGESAGAHAVTTLLATPAAAGLFHRAIAESSPADWALSSDDAARFARRCVTALGFDQGSAAAALADAAAHDIRRAVGREIRAVMRERPGMQPAVPVVDGEYLPRPPLAAMAGGKAHRVPLLIGTNRDEGTLFAKHLDQLPTNQRLLERLFIQAGPGAKDQVTAAYPDYPARHAAIRMGGDYIFWRPTVLAAQHHSRYAPTYTYRYDFAPRLMRMSGHGATHGSELMAVFGFGRGRTGRALTTLSGLRAATDLTQGHWLHFARHGTPRPGWPAYSPQQRATLILDARPRVEHDPDRPRRLAWAGIPSATLG